MHKCRNMSRKHGLTINTSVVIIAGWLMAHDANQLPDNGGKIELTNE